ncbi:MAG: DUF1461 domain-containing protein [Nanoarchaeota archaeon]
MTKLWPAIVLIAIFLPLVLLLGSAHAWIFSSSVYERHYGSGIYGSFLEQGYDRQAINDITSELLSFLGTRSHAALDTPPDFFGEDEVAHFTDVRAHMLNGKNFLRISILFLLLAVALLFVLSYMEMKTYWVSYGFKYLGMALTISSIAMLLFGGIAFVAFENFSSTFYYFHVLFFPQGNFAFSQDTNMIQLFPQYFFQQMGERIMITSAAAAIFALICGVLLSRSGPLWQEHSSV